MRAQGPGWQPLGSREHELPPEPPPEPPPPASGAGEEPALPGPCRPFALGCGTRAASGCRPLPAPHGSLAHSNCSQGQAGLARAVAASWEATGPRPHRAGVAVIQTVSIIAAASHGRMARGGLGREDGHIANLLIRAGRWCGRSWPRLARAGDRCASGQLRIFAPIKIECLVDERSGRPRRRRDEARYHPAVRRRAAALGPCRAGDGRAFIALGARCVPAIQEVR
jgi:hypothetical protein